jgi:uncharacterized protein YlaN (UPF0358 family)
MCGQFWTLEPDVICRLVFIKDVQYDESSSRGGSTASPAAVAQCAAPAASSSREGSPGASSSTSTQAIAGVGSSSQLRMPGLTELPTCPVCLERLDAHISGIVTTVRLRLMYTVDTDDGMHMCDALASCLSELYCAEQTAGRHSVASRSRCPRRECLVAGVQPQIPQRVPHAVGGHLLPGVPVLPGLRGPRVSLHHLQRRRGPVDLPHLRPHRLRPLPQRPCQRALEGHQPLLRAGAGDAAGACHAHLSYPRPVADWRQWPLQAWLHAV